MAITPELRRYLDHMPEGDDLALIVLKGHLLVEEALDRIIRQVVAHGDFLDDARLAFVQKAALARAMCWTRCDSDMWGLAARLNSLRNDLVHRLDSPKFQARLQDVLNAHLASIAEDARSGMKAETVPTQLRFAVAYLLGFLARYEKDANGFRSIVDGFLERARPCE